jgi:hypothetical protein
VDVNDRSVLEHVGIIVLYTKRFQFTLFNSGAVSYAESLQDTYVPCLSRPHSSDLVKGNVTKLERSAGDSGTKLHTFIPN